MNEEVTLRPVLSYVHHIVCSEKLIKDVEDEECENSGEYIWCSYFFSSFLIKWETSVDEHFL